MIDVEKDVFDHVYQSVVHLLPDGCFKSVYVPRPSKFPFATLIETGNETSVRNRTSADEEQFAILTYEANVYSMSKSECRAVMDAIDTSMTTLGFTRRTLQFVPNLADSTLFRYVARYTAEADNNKTIYRRV